MTPEYVTGLIGVFGSLCAVAAFAWAAKNRQLKTEDRAMYEAVADDEPDYTDMGSGPAARTSRAGRVLFVAAFASVFLVIGWLVVQTVRVAGHPQPPPPVSRQRPAPE